MRERVDIKIVSTTPEDLKEVSFDLQTYLRKKYIVIPSPIMENDNRPGVHQFITLKPLPSEDDEFNEHGVSKYETGRTM